MSVIGSLLIGAVIGGVFAAGFILGIYIATEPKK